MPRLKQLLRELVLEIDRISARNELLERRLAEITGALRGAVRTRPATASRAVHASARSRASRRGAPTRFNDEQALQLRKDYERGANSAQLAKKYKAALPTILSTLRRAGTTLRRGRPRN